MLTLMSVRRAPYLADQFIRMYVGITNSSMKQYDIESLRLLVTWDLRKFSLVLPHVLSTCTQSIYARVSQHL